MLRGWRIKLVVGLGLLAVLSILAFLWIRRIEKQEQQQLEIPLVWARLAPYPASARDLRASTSGSMFTRSFRVLFSAPPADVDRWLQDSPGTREAKPETPSPGCRHFEIRPGGGAQHAEVTVDDATGQVRISVYWS